MEIRDVTCTMISRAHPEFFIWWGGGGDKIYVQFENICYKNHKYPSNITPFETEFIYIQI